MVTLLAPSLLKPRLMDTDRGSGVKLYRNRTEGFGMKCVCVYVGHFQCGRIKICVDGANYQLWYYTNDHNIHFIHYFVCLIMLLCCFSRQ